MISHHERTALARRFHAALAARAWSDLRALLTDDARWVLPGENTISGAAEGADAVVARGRQIAGYGLTFELQAILVSPTDVALLLHNTAKRDDRVLDEKVATVCRIRDGQVAFIETFLSDVEGMNAFFV